MTRLLIIAVLCAGCRARFEVRDDGRGSASTDASTDGRACTQIAGLLGYWPMEQGDINGIVLSDRSGNTNDGAILGTQSFTLGPGVRGDALEFPTTTAHVDIAGLPFTGVVGDAVTISFWYHRAGPATASEVLVDMPPSPRYDVWLFNGRLCVNTQGGECWGMSDPTLYDRWVHVAAVMKNGPSIESSMFVDGVKRVLACTNAACTASRTVANPLRLGADDVYAFHGKLDEVRLYDRELTDTEVQTVFAGTACP